MIIRIKNLLLRTIIGYREWEREKAQDVVINVTLEMADPEAIKSDDVSQTVDYKTVAKRIIAGVERTEFLLLERLAGFILDLAMEDQRVVRATVEIDKPHALRFAESVSVTLERRR